MVGISYDATNLASSVTYDGGQSWTPINTGTSFSTVYFFDATHGWAGGYSQAGGVGGVYKYTGTALSPPVVTALGGLRCGAGPVTLTASGAPTGGQYRWYTAPAGGTSIPGAITASFTTPSLSNTTTYYVSATTACGTYETARTAVTATIATAPSAPVTVGACGISSVTLTASGSPVGGSYRWYTVSSGGTPIAGATSATYTTPALSTTTTYYVSAVTSTANGGCESTRTPVTATLTSNLSAPTATGATTTGCGAGSVTLTATGAPAGGTYGWYTTVTGGTPILGITSGSYTTPVLSATTTYYVSTFTSAANGGCESPRTAVTAVVKLQPTAAIVPASSTTFCSGSVTLAANAGAALSAGSTTALNALAGSGTPIICDCPPGYVAVGYTGRTGSWMDQVQLACKQLRADGTLGNTVVYTSSNGTSTGGGATGPYLFPDNTVMVGATAYTNSNYIASLQGYGQSVAYIAGVGANNNTPTTNGLMSAASLGNVLGTVYAPSGAVITGMSGWSGLYTSGITFRYTPIAQFLETYLWSNGATTPTIVAGTLGTYTVTVSNAQGCSVTSAPITVTATTAPPAPSVTGNRRCGTGVVTLTATGAPSGGSYAWYTTATGGVPINGATSGSYTTPVLALSTTYYVSALSASSCEGPRTPVIATIDPAVPIPTVTALPSTVSLGQATTLSVTSPVAGTIYAWSGPGLTNATGPTVTVAPPATGPNTYTITANVGNCSANSQLTVAVTLPPPTITGFTPSAGPAGTSVVITGSGLLGNTAVSFNGVAATFSGVTNTAITAIVPPGATTGPVSVTTPGGTTSGTSNFTVVPVTLAVQAAVCLNAGTFALTGGSPAGGTYTGPGVSGGQFNPLTAGAGRHTITYSYTLNGVTSTATQPLTVSALPSVTLAAFVPRCQGSAAFILAGGLPTGGTYSGVGVSGGLFNPTMAGVGTHTITYSYTDGNGCTASAIQTITVLPTPTFASSATQVCTGQPVTLTVSNAGPGATYLWSPGGQTTASITNSPTAATTYSVTVTNAAGCTYPFSQVVTISPYTIPLGTVNLSLPLANAQNLEPAGTTLSWAPVAQAVSYDVYLWLSSSPVGQPATPLISNLTSINLALPAASLAFGQTYNWQVVARNPCFSRASAVRTFSTRFLPDLRVTNLAAPATATVNQTLTVSWRVTNSGAGGTGSTTWTDYVYLSPDHDIRVAEDVLLGQFPNQQALQPNQSYVQTLDLAIPSTVRAGSYHLYVLTNRIDAYCQSVFINGTDSCSTVRGIHSPPTVTETNIANNWRHQPLTIQYPASLPDLALGPIGVPSVAFTSSQLNATYRLINRGTASARGNLSFPSGPYLCDGNYWLNSFYLSRDSMLSTATDVLLSTERFFPRDVKFGARATVFVPGTVTSGGGGSSGSYQCAPGALTHSDVIEVDSSLVTRAALVIPFNTLSGTYYVLAVADAGDNVLEGYGENNNVRASSPIAITLAPPPDLVVTQVTAPATAGVGHTLAVSWQVQNDGAKAPDASETVWYDKVFLSRLPTFNPDSAIALGELMHTVATAPFGPGARYSQSQSLPLPRGLSGQFYVYVWTDAHNQVFEYNADGNNISRSPNRVNLTYTTYPDLVVTSISLPDTVVFGQPYTMSWTIKNQGLAATAGAFVDQIVASADTLLSSSYAVQSSAAYSGIIQPGQSVTRQLTHTFSYQPALANRRAYYFVRTDATDAVYEYGHENNNQSGTHRVGRGGVFMKVVVSSGTGPSSGPLPVHDLRPLALSAPASAGSGSRINMTARVRNFGPDSIASGTWRDVVYLSTDTVLSAGDQNLTYISRQATRAAGNSYSQSLAVTLPNGISGMYYLLYSTGESASGVYDAVPANNVRFRPIAMQLTSPADLVVTSMVSPDSLYAGQTIRLPYRLANQGAGTTVLSRSPWYVGAYLSTTPTLTGTARQVGSRPLTQTLAAGAALVDTVTFTVPSTYLGNYYLIVKADNSDDIYEYNAEGNNTRNQPVYVQAAPQADLVVTDVSGPATALLGVPTTLSYTVRNTGAYATVGTLTNNLYVSNNRPYLSAGDRFFGQQTLQGLVLAPGAQLTRTVTATPLALKPGYYRSVAQANALQQVAETNYTNNRLVGSDSTHWDVSVLPLGVQVRNIPLAATDHLFYQLTVAANLDVLLTLSSNLTTGSNELYVAYDRIPTSSDYDYRFTTPESPIQQIVLPATHAGTYYIYVRNASQSPIQQVSLLAQPLPYSIRSITPSTVGKGVVTTALNGAGFRSGIRVRLRNSSSSIVATAQVTRFISTMELRLRWDLTTVPAGAYTVETENPNGDMQQLPDGLHIVPATTFSVDYQEQAPSTLRAGRSGEFVYSFRNTSNVDIPVLHGQFSMLSGAQITNVRGTAGNPLLGSRWNLTSTAGATAVKDWYAPGDGLVYVPFIARNVPPGGQVTIQFTAGLQHYRSNELTVRQQAFAYETSDLLARLGAQIETMRRFLLANPVELKVNVSPAMMALVANRKAYADTLLTRLFRVGLLEPADTVGFDFTCDSCLHLDSAPVTSTGQLFNSGYAIATQDTTGVALSANGAYRWKINKYGGQAGQALGWDLLRVNGTLAVQASPSQPFVIQVTSFSYLNQPGLLAGWYPAVDASWPIAIASGGITGFAATKFSVDASRFSAHNNLYGGSFSVHQAGDTLKLVFTAARPGLGMAGIPGAPGAPGEPGSPGGKGGSGNNTIAPGVGGKGGQGGPGIPDWAAPNGIAVPAGNGGRGGEGGDPLPNTSNRGGHGGDGGDAGDFALNSNGTLTGAGTVGLGGSPGQSSAGYPSGNPGNAGQVSSRTTAPVSTSPDAGTVVLSRGLGDINNPAGKSCNPLPVSDDLCDATVDALGTMETFFNEKAKFKRKGVAYVTKYLSKAVAPGDPMTACTLDAMVNFVGDRVELIGPEDLNPVGVAVFFKDFTIAGLQLGLRLYNCQNQFGRGKGQVEPGHIDQVGEWINLLDIGKGFKLDWLVNGSIYALKKLCVPIVNPCDPNEIQGPEGYGPAKIVAASATLPYKVLFENDSAQASASAQRINIRVPIDRNLNPLSVQLGDVNFHNRTMHIPSGLASYHTVFPLADSIGVDVELTAGVDVVRRELFWEFQAIDRATGLPPANPLAGFLPANSSTHDGEGFVLFSMRPRRGAVTGDSIKVKAAIVFDNNDVIDTNETLNTVDAVAPHSLVSPIAAAADSVYQIRVLAQDDTGGSGVRSFDLYVSTDAQNYQPYLAGLTASPVSFTARAGQNYYFYALVTDNVGNAESAKTAFEASIAPCPLPTAVQVLNITTTTAGVAFVGSLLATGGYQAIATPVGGGAPVSVQGTSSPLVLNGLSPGTSYTLIIRGDCGGADSFTSPILFTTAGTPLPDLVVSTNQTLHGGNYRNVTIVAGGILHLTSSLTVAGAMSVQTGGMLDTHPAGTASCALVSGTGSFELMAGATLRICDPAGITLSGSTGSVQVEGTRRFSSDASYVYDGLAPQVTGAGLPAQVRYLGNVGEPLALSQAVSIAQVLEANAAFNTAGMSCTLLSSAQGTALVRYNDTTNPTMTGNVTVQRYIDPAQNPGPGYRHYASPVINAPFADLTTSGFTPTLNPAYNTAAQPNTVTPFPTVFGYDESRIPTTVSNYGAFDKGWFSPGGNLVTGRGYTVNIPATEKVDFVGLLYNGTLNLPLSFVPSAVPGWQLLGNPYAAPLDWSLVNRPVGMDAAMYVFSSTGQYTGNYRAYLNGIGSGSPIVPSSQGFFVRTTAAATLTVTNAARVIEFRTTDPTFQRGNDPRPQLKLELQAGTPAAPTGLADASYLYLEAGATTGVDAAYDAVKLGNPSGLNLSSEGPGAATALAINGMPLTSLSSATVIPLHVALPSSGTYTLRAASRLNLPDNLDIVLTDMLTGQRIDLRHQPDYQFAAVATAPVTGRFFLNLVPGANPLATTTGLTASNVSVFPNPTHQAVTVLVPAVRGAATVEATLLSVLGQTVHQQKAELPATGTRLTLDVSGLASGVYMLRLQAASATLIHRVVVE
ncbi:Ig-like domain-containing protein [Hymenobacter jeollabukensis]|nr:CARDB domain-containing protein [Hymenobacter jeollabukensis]